MKWGWEGNKKYVIMYAKGMCILYMKIYANMWLLLILQFFHIQTRMPSKQKDTLDFICKVQIKEGTLFWK